MLESSPLYSCAALIQPLSSICPITWSRRAAARCGWRNGESVFGERIMPASVADSPTLSWATGFPK